MNGRQMLAWYKELTEKNRQLNFQRPGVLFYMEKISGLETCVVYGGRFLLWYSEAAWFQWGGGGLLFWGECVV